jgi:hypothetical protein
MSKFPLEFIEYHYANDVKCPASFNYGHDIPSG